METGISSKMAMASLVIFRLALPARVCASGVFPLNSHIQYSLTRTPPGAFATHPTGVSKIPARTDGSSSWTKSKLVMRFFFPPPGNGSDELSIATTPSVRRAHTMIG